MSQSALTQSPPTQSARADLLRRLHHGPPILVLPNAWDVATTSAAVAACLGFEDGEPTPAQTRRISPGRA